MLYKAMCYEDIEEARATSENMATYLGFYRLLKIMEGVKARGRRRIGNVVAQASVMAMVVLIKLSIASRM